MDSDTWLLLFDDTGKQRLKLIEIESDPTARVAEPGLPQNGASTAATTFDFAGVLAVKAE